MNKNFFRSCTIAGAIGLLAACGDSAIAPNTAIAPSERPALATNTPGNGGGACMGDDALAFGEISINDPEDVVCTAQDIDIGVAKVSSWSTDGVHFNTLNPGDRISCTPDQTVYVNMSAVDETS